MGKKIKILLAEDEIIIAQCLKMDLEKHGYEVCKFVSRGEDAIETAKKEDPDVILMDIHLSGKMDGIEAAMKIIAHKNIPIIFMTGYNETNIFERAQKINPVACLGKPIEFFELKPVIDSIFK